MTVGDNTARERPTFAVGESNLCSVDMRGVLDDGELIDSVSSVAEVPNVGTATDLTITNEIVSQADLVINGLTVPTGKAVQFLVSGQSLNTDYTLKITFVTDSSPAQTKVKYVKFKTEGP